MDGFIILHKYIDQMTQPMVAEMGHKSLVPWRFNFESFSFNSLIASFNIETAIEEYRDGPLQLTSVNIRGSVTYIFAGMWFFFSIFMFQI